MTRFIIHYGIHFIVPVLVAFIWYRKSFLKSAFVLLSGIVIDLDHLLANPIFDANRCSIGFHPLHSHLAIIIYLAIFVYPKTRIIGLALLIHILADITDCFLMQQGIH